MVEFSGMLITHTYQINLLRIANSLVSLILSATNETAVPARSVRLRNRPYEQELMGRAYYRQSSSCVVVVYAFFSLSHEAF